MCVIVMLRFRVNGSVMFRNFASLLLMQNKKRIIFGSNIPRIFENGIFSQIFFLFISFLAK